MATPITNNPTALASNSKTVRPEPQGSGNGQAQAVQEGSVNGGQEGNVTVSRAGQVLSQQPSERGQGVINSAEQAMQMAKGLRALFDGGGGQAVAAQAARISPDMMGLLQAG